MQGPTPTSDVHETSFSAHRKGVKASLPSTPTLQPATRTDEDQPPSRAAELDNFCAEVPQELRDFLAGSHLSELIHQFRVWDLKRDGALARIEFSRAMTSLGVPRSMEENEELFSALSSEPNQEGITLQDLINLKHMVDRELCQQGDGQQTTSERHTRTKEAHVGVGLESSQSAIELRRERDASTGCFRKLILQPVTGALWKMQPRPHQALPVVDPFDTGAALGDDVDLSTQPTVELNQNQSFVEQCATVQDEIMLEAERTASTIATALDRVRRADLKLELAIASRPVEARTSSGTTHQLRKYLMALAGALQGGLISVARFASERDDMVSRACRGQNDQNFERYLTFFHGSRNKTQIGRFSKLVMAMLIVYIVLWGSVYVSKMHNLLPVREACELVWNACNRPQDTTTCLVEEDARILIPPNFTGIISDSGYFVFEQSILSEKASRCDLRILEQSTMFLAPLIPLVLISMVLPFGLFFRNLHTATTKSLLIWTPQVPLILVQVAMRAVVLTRPAWTAADSVYARIVAVEAWCLFFQTGVFLLMDAMKLPTPKLRIVFAVVLSIRYLASLIGRMRDIFPAEQRLLLPEATVLRGLGATPGQQFVISMDWAVAALLLGAVGSAILEPSKLAMKRLRTDTLGFFNWRYSYMAQMQVRSRHRDAWISSEARHLRARVKVAHARRAAANGSSKNLRGLRKYSKGTIESPTMSPAAFSQA